MMRLLTISRISVAALLLAVALVMMLAAASSGARAHASLVQASPADGAVVATPPQRFVLTFNEPVSPFVLRLVLPSGKTISLPRYELHDHQLIIEAPAMPVRGTYALSWRVVSEDGHPVGGSVIFSIGTVTASRGVADTTDLPLGIAIWSARVCFLIALLFGAGGAFFHGWLCPLPRRDKTALALFAVTGISIGLLSIGLQGLDVLGLPLSSLPDKSAWQTGFRTSYSATVILAVMALSAALASLSLPDGKLCRLLSLLALAGSGLAAAASGHASNAEPHWLTTSALFTHVVCTAFWLGALLPIAGLLRSDSQGAVMALQRFSLVIPVFVGALLASGLVLTFIQVETVGALWRTAYGNVLLVKLGLVATLLALAAVNRWRLTAQVADNRPARRKLVRMIGAEIIIATAIFAVIALWRFTPPPRVLAAAAEASISIEMHATRAIAKATLDSARVGAPALSVQLMTADFAPLEAKEVKARLSNRAAGIEDIERPMRRQADGTWRVDALPLPAAGRWKLELDVLVSDFEQITLEQEIDVRP